MGRDALVNDANRNELLVSNTNLSQHPITRIDIPEQEKHYSLEFSETLITALDSFPTRRSRDNPFDELIDYFIKLGDKQRDKLFPDWNIPQWRKQNRILLQDLCRRLRLDLFSDIGRQKKQLKSRKHSIK